MEVMVAHHCKCIYHLSYDNILSQNTTSNNTQCFNPSGKKDCLSGQLQKAKYTKKSHFLCVCVCVCVCNWGLNSELHTCKAGALWPESLLQSVSFLLR
jgi:hypothetical protein